MQGNECTAAANGRALREGGPPVTSRSMTRPRTPLVPPVASICSFLFIGRRLAFAPAALRRGRVRHQLLCTSAPPGSTCNKTARPVSARALRSRLPECG